MERITKLILVGWTLAALAFEVRLLSGSWPGLAVWMPLLTAAAAALSAYSGRAVSVVLGAAYLIPVIARELRGGAPYAPNETIWLAPLVGVMLPDLLRSSWRIPALWRVPLVFAACVVAATAPVVVLREVDFIPGLLLEREAWHWVGSTYPSSFAAWAMYVALTFVVGVLWFDWLLGRPREQFTSTIVVPLMVSASVLVAVAIYQFLVDVSFLNPTVYARFRRATGTMFDANLSGMVAAMWIGGSVVLASRLQRLRVPVTVVALLAGWMAVWATVSRTSLAAATVVSVVVLAALARDVKLRPAYVAVASGVVVLLLLLMTAGGGRTTSPLVRIQRMLPSPSVASVRDFAAELWNRNSYGTAATRAIVRYPWFGLGVGSFHLLGSWLVDRDKLPPDNAQNWLRHQVAELGFVGGAGAIAWAVLFAVFVLRRRPDAAFETRVLRGVLVAFGAVSMLGVPGQDAAIAMTFWVFVCWFVMHADPHAAARRLPPWWPVPVLMLAIVAVGGTAVTARGDLRPARRALTADWAYSYGFAPPQVSGPDAGFRLGAERAVAVLPRTHRWLVVTVRRRDPAAGGPLSLRVEVDGVSVLKGQLSTALPIQGAVEVSDSGDRLLLEVEAEAVGTSHLPVWSVPLEPYLITWEFAGERPRLARP